MFQSRREYRFAWREDNRFKLLIDGEQFFPAMLAAIHDARRFVMLEMYLIESGGIATRIIDALSAAAQRGVRVKVLLDHYGSLGLHDEDRARLRGSGADVHFYNRLAVTRWRRSLYRDHRKILIVDGSVAFIGGAGITDEFITTGAQPGWRETLVEARGAVVGDWCQLFREGWQRSSNKVLSIDYASVVKAGSQRGRVVSNQAHGPWEIHRSILNRMRSARHLAWLATAYFVPSWKLRRALRFAARAGTDVRLLLPGPFSDHPGVRHAGRRHYGGLLRHGVRIYEYQPRFMHQKILLCDSWTSIGSSNVDRWGQRWNLEANQEIDDVGFARETAAMLAADFALAQEITYADWSQRSWSRRFLEKFWGRVDALLQLLER